MEKPIYLFTCLQEQKQPKMLFRNLKPTKLATLALTTPRTGVQFHQHHQGCESCQNPCSQPRSRSPFIVLLSPSRSHRRSGAHHHHRIIVRDFFFEDSRTHFHFPKKLRGGTFFLHSFHSPNSCRSLACCGCHCHIHPGRVIGLRFKNIHLLSKVFPPEKLHRFSGTSSFGTLSVLVTGWVSRKPSEQKSSPTEGTSLCKYTHTHTHARTHEGLRRDLSKRKRKKKVPRTEKFTTSRDSRPRKNPTNPSTCRNCTCHGFTSVSGGSSHAIGAKNCDFLHHLELRQSVCRQDHRRKSPKWPRTRETNL